MRASFVRREMNPYEGTLANAQYDQRDSLVTRPLSDRIE
jgi:hypothetical protein